MIVKVRKGYTLFVGNRRYTSKDNVIDIDAKTYESQSWKVEIVIEQPTIEDISSDRMIRKENTIKKKKGAV